MSTTGTPAAAIHAAVTRAMVDAYGDQVAGQDPLIRASEFADFQVNAALPLARLLKQSPRQIADTIVSNIDLTGVITAAEVSGPGYINLTVNPTWLGAHLVTILSASAATTPQTVVIDYSSPNVAKEMHVGHIRTTIVGDALARLHEQAGYHVIRQNHIGDWGTPFGMLIEYSVDQAAAGVNVDTLVTDPNAFYQAARQQFDTNPTFAARARARVVQLQAHDPATIMLWEELVNRSIAYFTGIYDLLNVSLTPADIRGESAYDTDLAAICAELENAGLATISDGALCVFPAGFTNRDGDPLPLILRKQDGGYTYATTDLAAAKYRLVNLAADQIIYVVGEAQAMHLNMVFDTVQRVGWNTRQASLTHVQIGNMLGADGKLLRTRSGDSVKLATLVQDAIDAAAAVLHDTDMPAALQAQVARQVGIGALKYADLAMNHDTSYTFDLQRMVALTGNTGPYLQYTCVRINSILRQADLSITAPLLLGTAEEKTLALALTAYQAVLDTTTTTAAPHLLCAHLFNLAQTFSRFYAQHQVLQAADPAVRASRLHLCHLTLAQLTAGLTLLGIQIPTQM